jgi:hypothetical protein
MSQFLVLMILSDFDNQYQKAKYYYIQSSPYPCYIDLIYNQLLFETFLTELRAQVAKRRYSEFLSTLKSSHRSNVSNT